MIIKSITVLTYSMSLSTLFFSQFFITLAPCQHLDGNHTIFGRISSGMGVIKRIGSVETDRNDCPLSDVTILYARINES